MRRGNPCSDLRFRRSLRLLLEVSPLDGRLRATAATFTANKTAVFRVMLLTRPLVDMLLDSMSTANTALWARRHHRTSSGCACSGYSNDHGFGAYCYGWEYETQVPWCYVDGSCASQETKGSFGRKYADCDLLDERPASEGGSEQSPGSAGEGVEGPAPDWLEDEAPAEDYAKTNELWDETGNFTGMDEYWAGRRSFDEGEEEPWSA